jgi:hypothetical protein
MVARLGAFSTTGSHRVDMPQGLSSRSSDFLQRTSEACDEVKYVPSQLQRVCMSDPTVDAERQSGDGDCMALDNLCRPDIVSRCVAENPDGLRDGCE